MIDFPHLNFDKILVLKIGFFIVMKSMKKTSNDRARKDEFFQILHAKSYGNESL